MPFPGKYRFGGKNDTELHGERGRGGEACVSRKRGKKKKDVGEFGAVSAKALCYRSRRCLTCAPALVTPRRESDRSWSSAGRWEFKGGAGLDGATGAPLAWVFVLALHFLVRLRV